MFLGQALQEQGTLCWNVASCTQVDPGAAEENPTSGKAQWGK